MKVLYFSLKGGVGKSSISLSHALTANLPYVTNDISTNIDKATMKNFHQIPHNTKRIPKKILNLENIIYDFGAMSSVIDSKVTQAVLACDVVVIPTLTDVRSLEATLQTYKLIKGNAKKIIIIINNYSKMDKFEFAYEYLRESTREANILDIRTTTLFERIARDGVAWFENIGHKKGEWQLLRSKAVHLEVFRTIKMMSKGKR